MPRLSGRSVRTIVLVAALSLLALAAVPATQGFSWLASGFSWLNGFSWLASGFSWLNGFSWLADGFSWLSGFSWL
jgi:hypothetical protein